MKYLLLIYFEARDVDEAIGLAARIPMARKGTVEVRPVIEPPGIAGYVEGSSEIQRPGRP